jgi:hypothetical protein
VSKFQEKSKRAFMCNHEVFLMLATSRSFKMLYGPGMGKFIEAENRMESWV